ncbi:hypothetical protein [Alkalibacterium subtropicum]|nr:hypothetical protein [Alkalibacterium subtropicum]
MKEGLSRRYKWSVVTSRHPKKYQWSPEEVSKAFSFREIFSADTK